MKTSKLWGVLVVLLTFSLVLAGCDNATSPDGDDPNGGEGTTLVSNAQVYNADMQTPLSSSVNADYGYNFDYVDGKFIYVPLSTDFNNVEVTINGGKLTLNLGTPKPGTLIPVVEDSFPSELTVIPADAKQYSIPGFYTQDGRSYLSLEKKDGGSAAYMYVDRDTSIVGSHTDLNEKDGKSYTTTFNLNLKTGWNQCLKIFSTDSTTSTIKTGTADSSYKWYISSNN